MLEAFLPAVKLHLGQAYGWFLLSVSGVEESALNRPPGKVADLPAPAMGQMHAPELAEFSQLEIDGWLADMLNDTELGNPAAQLASGDGLLVSDRQSPGCAVAAGWASSLGEIMARMDDSLAEC